MGFEGKNVVVTGSSRGIGKAVALDLASRGCGVVINCVKRVDLAGEVAQEIRDSGSRALIVQADVSTEEGARKLIEESVRYFGKIHALVNNAGVAHLRAIESMDKETLSRVLETDLASVFYTSKFALKHMVENGIAGVIVNISSIVGMIGMRGATAYAAAKAGLNGFTVCLAREVARYGIRVNGVAPGYVETEMIAGWPQEHFKKVIPRIPMRRLGQPHEIAEVVSFLIGSGTYITGQTIIVDGGIMID